MKNKRIILILVFLTILFTLIGGTFAFLRWKSSDTEKTLVSFSINSTFSCSVDAGGNITSSDMKLAPATCTDSNYAIQRTLTANSSITGDTTIYMDLWLNVDHIDTGLANTNYFKYAVTKTPNDCSNPITSGTFYGLEDGNKVKLINKNDYTGTATDQYYLYIWLDEEERNPATMNQAFALSVGGQCIEFGEDSLFEITSLNLSGRVIDAEVINGQRNIVAYAVTNSSTVPASWTEIDSTEQSNSYNLQYTLNSAGTYYVWFKDADGNTVSETVHLASIDETGPVCTFGSFSQATVGNGEGATIELTCIDAESQMQDVTPTINDFSVSNDRIIIRNVNRQSVSNGYKYVITVVGTSNDGRATITVPEDTIKNVLGIGNEDVTSSNLVVQNFEDTEAPTITMDPNSSSNYESEYTVDVIITDKLNRIANNASIKYGWSTSNTVEPTSYTQASLNYSADNYEVTFEAYGDNLNGDYYLWVTPVVLADTEGNSNTTPTISTGTFKFDNDNISAPIVSFEDNVVTNGLVYQFDGRNNTGSGHSNTTTSWHNFGSSNTHGTLNGPTWGDNYLEFDGTNDYVPIASYSSNYYTLEAMFSVDSIGTRYNIISNVEAGGIQLYVTTDGHIHSDFKITSSEWSHLYDSTVITPNTIYNASVTYNGSTVILYVNGVKVSSLSAPTLLTPTSGTYMTLGCDPNTSGGCSAYYLDGKIYSARVYNRALTQAEIRQNYNMDKLSIGEYANGHPNFTLSGSTSSEGLTISKYEYYYDAESEINWEEYNNSNKPAINYDEPVNIYARAMNSHGKYGDVSVTDLYLDNVSPTGTLSISDDNFVIEATIDATDADSGLSGVYGYKVSSSSTCDSTTTGFVEVENSTYNINVTSSGEQYVCVRFDDNAGNYGYAVQKLESSYYVYTGASQQFTADRTGYYYVETYGASGGGGSNGGYASGYIYLTANETLYVYVGGEGSSSTTIANAGGYNGGGPVSLGSSAYKYSGGGATDIRLVNGAWDNAASLNSRIMVAGGGGGSTESTTNSSYSSSGGVGGGLIGGSSSGGTYTNSSLTASAVASGGTQTAGGTDGSTNGNASYRTGQFGFASQTTTTDWGGGGGGGYYGGATGYGRAGGGGSSFISGYAGVNAIDSSRNHTNNTLHYSNKYFIKGTMSSGVNSGDGKAKITYIGNYPEKINTNLNNVRYIKDCVNENNKNRIDSWVEIQAIKNGVNLAYNKTIIGTAAERSSDETYNRAYVNITDGLIDNYEYTYGESVENGLQCVTIDLTTTYDLDEIAVWHQLKDGRTYNNNVTFVSSNGNDWIPVMADQVPESSHGKRVNAWEIKEIDLNEILNIDYTYRADYQPFSVPVSGYYKVETWGAQGGSANETYTGGLGAYTSGYIYLDTNDILQVYVGSQGVTSTTVGRNSGGYNGGGQGYTAGTAYPAAGGGGATDIRIVSGAWDNAASLNSRIMVAAGGGGSSYNSTGSAGGGLFGNSISGGSTAGTQTSGGIAVSLTNNGSNGGFGFGGDSAQEAVPGGGSGYYGGGGSSQAAGDNKGAPSGSSFISGYAGVNAINSSRSHTNNTLHYSEQYFIDGAMTAGVNEGAGKAKITYVGDAPQRVNTSLNNVRYVKDCINGNSTNTGNHWVELQAIKNGINLAKNKNVTGSSLVKTTGSAIGTGTYTTITDGDITSTNYSASADVGYQCITIDLESIYGLDEIAVWHYFNDRRTYYNNVTYVSSNGSIWTEVIHKTEAETSNGKRVNAWHVEEPVYSVIYDANGGTGAPLPTTYTYSENGTVNLSTVEPLRDDYAFVGWATTSDSSAIDYAPGAAYSRANASDNRLYAVWVVAVNPIATFVSTTNNLKATSQTASLKCTDDVGVIGYYWGTTSPTESSTYTSVTSTKTFTIDKTVNSGATYYFACKDNQGNISNIISKTYLSYTVTNMLETAGGTENTYTTANYAQSSTGTYIAESGTTLALADIYTRPNYSSVDRFRGVSTGAASTTAASVSTTAPTLDANNTTYTMWWNRNRVIFRFKPNGGTLNTTSNSAGTETYTWSTDSNGWITRSVNSGTYSAISTTLRYGATSLNLWDYNYAYGLNITKASNSAVSGSEWICESGCTTANKTFSHAAITINATDICAASTLQTAECTVVVKVNWTTVVQKSDITYSGNWSYTSQGSGNWYVKLTSGSSATFKLAKASAVDIFIVGGGGKGGTLCTAGDSGVLYTYAGGGGAGGHRTTQTNVSLAANTNYTVTVGAASKASSFKVGSTTYSAAAGSSGGSASCNGGGSVGTGGSGTTGTSPSAAGGKGTTTGTAGAGKAGASPFGDSTYGTYGGGGAGGRGWRSVTSIDANEKFGTVASGGTGGGAASGKSASANTGGGGGGASSGINSGNAGTGGSGIIIIRNHR